MRSTSIISALMALTLGAVTVSANLCPIVDQKVELISLQVN